MSQSWYNVSVYAVSLSGECGLPGLHWTYATFQFHHSLKI
jgi:hypothetical protein